MSNVTILPPGSGPDQVRALLRHLVALPPESDPAVVAPHAERFALGTTRGKVRDRNEDRVAVMRVLGGNGDRPWMLFALCDGMGGMTDGARAAEIALSAFLSAALASRQGATAANLHRSVMVANAAVYSEFRGRGGATLSAMAWDSNQIITANAGDSRIWALNGAARLQMLTRDDSIAAQLQAQGVEAEDARRDLLQFVGIGDELSPHTDSRPPDAIRCVIATSDGAHDGPPQALSRIAHHAGTPGDLVARLIDLSLWYGGLDNASVVCFQPSPVPGGAAGVVELWVPAGYWRIVRSDTAAPAVERPLPVPQSAAAPQLATPAPSPGASSKPAARASADLDPERAIPPRNRAKSKPSGGQATGRRDKPAPRERGPASLFDDSGRPDAAGEPGPGHVQIRIGPAAGDGADETSIAPKEKE